MVKVHHRVVNSKSLKIGGVQQFYPGFKEMKLPLKEEIIYI
jgi:hypothetical protein